MIIHQQWFGRVSVVSKNDVILSSENIIEL